MIILGLETSCDETAAAIVGDDRRIHANVVHSQIKDHAVHGGVVPEIAARAHLSAMNAVIDAALQQAGMTFADLDGIAATAGPGLIGGVMVGMMTGKALAAQLGKPFIGVNHLEGHALSPRLAPGVDFPYLLLLVSGGHTQILLAEGVGRYTKLAATIDDAAGECFDKTAKLLGLPQPGGPALAALAREAKNPGRFELPRPMLGKKGMDFSFSGLKTAARERIDALCVNGDIKRGDAADLAAALEATIAGHLADRCEKAIRQTRDKKPIALVAAGGVAANTTVRARLESLCAEHGLPFVAPPADLCTDNGAMIAWAGIERLKAGFTSGFDIPARPRWPLDENSVKIAS